MREGDVRIPAGCAIVGIFSKNGEKMDGGDIVKSIAVMHDRSNGLGGGFAAYGIYPEHKDFYAFHTFFDDDASKEACEALLKSHFVIVDCSEIPVKNIPAITDKPLIWRYFVTHSIPDGRAALGGTGVCLPLRHEGQFPN
jgi:glutamate synthase domain-containing protein 1